MLENNKINPLSNTDTCALDAYTSACRTTPLQHKGWLNTGINLYNWSLKPTKRVCIPSNNAVTLAVHLGGARRVRVYTDTGISERFSRPGDITLIPQGQSIHYLIDGPVQFATLHFPASATKIFGDDDGGNLLQLPHCLFAIHDEYTVASIRALLRVSSLRNAYGWHYRNKVLESLVWHLLGIVTNGNLEPTCLAQLGDAAPLQVKAIDFSLVLAEIDKKLGDRLKIDDLADIAGLGRTVFCEQFAKQLGRPPHRFIVNRRIERAKHLLEAQTLSVTAIAFELGFSSASHFSGAFKTATGSTPRAYASKLQQ